MNRTDLVRRAGMPRLRTTAAAALGIGLTLAAAGCGGERPSAGTEGGQGVAVPSSPTTSPSVPPTSQQQTLPPKCRDGDPLTIGRAPVDAAAGHRYLRIDVRNCTPRPVALDRPSLTGVTDSQTTGRLRLTPTPVAGRPEEPFTLGPGETASAGLEWLAEPREGRLQKLRVAAATDDIADTVPFDVLEMNLSTQLDYYSWVASPDDVF